MSQDEGEVQKDLSPHHGEVVEVGQLVGIDGAYEGEVEEA